MSAGESESFGIKLFRSEPRIPELFAGPLGAGPLGAYARETDVSDALASWNPDSDGRFGAGRGTGTAAAATRGAAAGGATSADEIAGPGGKMSPIRRSSKDVERYERCKDELGGLGCSNENRSAKA